MKQTARISPCPVAARPPPASARSSGWQSQERQLSPSQSFVMGRNQARSAHHQHERSALIVTSSRKNSSRQAKRMNHNHKRSVLTMTSSKRTHKRQAKFMLDCRKRNALAAQAKYKHGPTTPEMLQQEMVHRTIEIKQLRGTGITSKRRP